MDKDATLRLSHKYPKSFVFFKKTKPDTTNLDGADDASLMYFLEENWCPTLHSEKRLWLQNMDKY